MPQTQEERSSCAHRHKRLDSLRTAFAKLVVGHLTRPQMLVVRCWLWLAAGSRDLEYKRHCLKAVLELEPDNEPASLGLLVLDHTRPEN